MGGVGAEVVVPRSQLEAWIERLAGEADRPAVKTVLEEMTRLRERGAEPRRKVDPGEFKDEDVDMSGY